MHIHCPYCRHSLNLARDYVAKAVSDAEESKHKYHGLECPKCRKLIKVSLKEMRRYVPKTEPEPESESEE